MGELFHLDKYGLPKLCRSPSNCIYRERGHYETYEEAIEKAEAIKESFIQGYKYSDKLEQSIRSYYVDYQAMIEFLFNRQVSSVEDFDLIIISWLEREKIKQDMKMNKIGKALFSSGEILKIIEQEMIKQLGETLELEKYYYNPIPKKRWSPEMLRQHSTFKSVSGELARKLGYEALEVIVLPMYARRNLEKEGFLSTASNMREVVYRAIPKKENEGDIISYNHSIDEITKTFDVYEIAGAIEGITLYDVAYAQSPNSAFRKIWIEQNLESSGVSYEAALNKFISSQFFKGIQGTDVVRALVNCSPIVARDVRNYFLNYRRIMLVMKDKLVEENLEAYSDNVVFYDRNIEEDEWSIH